MSLEIVRCLPHYFSAKVKTPERYDSVRAFEVDRPNVESLKWKASVNASNKAMDKNETESVERASVVTTKTGLDICKTQR